jgi:hypothetical protein
VLGAGRRLFNGPAGAGDLHPVSVEQSGAAALLRYQATELTGHPGDATLPAAGAKKSGRGL